MSEPREKARYEAIGKERAERIRIALADALTTEHVEIADKTWSHRKHDGAADGRGHFRLRVVSSAFEGKSRLARHRLVYDALESLMATDIHALTIDAVTPAEFSPTSSKPRT